MIVPPQTLQFAASLIAILLLAWLVRKLGLGQGNRLLDNAAARAAAAEVYDGFEPVEIARDSGGRGAILCDAEGRIMVLRAHGVHFAGRVLAAGSAASTDGGDALVVDSGERRFGTVRLEIENPAPWAEAINALNRSNHA